jgi:Zn-dependent peptidase ImmA (M78 family)
MPHAKANRVAEIETCAADIVRRAAAFDVPVDLAKVADALDVTVHFDTLEDKVSGVLIVRSDERHALINATHHSNRQRFSLAHELGHLVLHESKGDRLFVDTTMRVYQRPGAATDAAYHQPESTTKPFEEREANRFASALLMPGELIEREAQSLDLSDENDIAHLARLFLVSDQAMSIRLQQLGLLQLANMG